MKTKIAIACQGGGSQTAFTAGVLQAFFTNHIQDKCEIVSLSGTSGGGICAFFAWLALHLKQDDCAQLLDFWHDNSAQNRWELMFNDNIIATLKAISKGQLPSLSNSPSSQLFKNSSAFASHGLRQEFRDFKYLLAKHADFDSLEQFCGNQQAPILVLGACNVLSGRLRKFSSLNETIQIEHLLASACIPSLFHAVEIGPDAYWDGLFSDNPPLDALIKKDVVGDNLPDEIWVIKINPTISTTIPSQADTIANRRNQLEGNLSLFQSLSQIEFLNDLFIEDAYRSFIEDGPAKERWAKFGIIKEIKIPKVFADDADKSYHIPMIEMSAELLHSLSYEGKLDRNPVYIQELINDGLKQGELFLKSRGLV
jgi:NTE family protein